MTLTDDRPHRIAAGPVAIVAQSGGLAMAIKRTLEERGILTSSLVTSGNEAGLTTADYIGYYATLPFVRVIVCYLEAVRDPETMRTACAAARRAGKPVVVLKLGASPQGRAAALAHTGAVAGPMIRLPMKAICMSEFAAMRPSRATCVRIVTDWAGCICFS